jgi:hypothetical protein
MYSCKSANAKGLKQPDEHLLCWAHFLVAISSPSDEPSIYHSTSLSYPIPRYTTVWCWAPAIQWGLLAWRGKRFSVFHMPRMSVQFPVYSILHNVNQQLQRTVCSCLSSWLGVYLIKHKNNFAFTLYVIAYIDANVPSMWLKAVAQGTEITTITFTEIYCVYSPGSFWTNLCITSTRRWSLKAKTWSGASNMIFGNKGFFVWYTFTKAGCNFVNLMSDIIPLLYF